MINCRNMSNMRLFTIWRRAVWNFLHKPLATTDRAPDILLIYQGNYYWIESYFLLQHKQLVSDLFCNFIYLFLLNSHFYI